MQRSVPPLVFIASLGAGFVACVSVPKSTARIDLGTPMYWAVDNQSNDTVPGAPLGVHVEWTDTCPSGGAAKSCNAQPFTLELSCTPRCALISGRSTSVPGGIHDGTVAATELGPLVVTATLIHQQTSERRVIRLPVITVHRPDEIRLLCDERAETPCSYDGVSAAKPLVYPAAIIRGRTVRSGLITLNNKPIPNQPPYAMSLADLFPQDREGDGVRPGTYTVVVALAGVEQEIQVNAR